MVTELGKCAREPRCGSRLWLPNPVKLSTGDELKRNTIHAITQARWLGPIVEDMSEVTSAAATMNLGADQDKEAAVLRSFDCPIDRSPEARPTRFAIELGA